MDVYTTYIFTECLWSILSTHTDEDYNSLVSTASSTSTIITSISTSEIRKMKDEVRYCIMSVLGEEVTESYF